MNTGKQQTYTAVSVVIDAIVLTVSYVISYLIQFALQNNLAPFDSCNYWPPLVIIVISYLMLYAFFHIYGSFRMTGRRKEAVLIGKVNIIGALILFAVFFVISNTDGYNWICWLFANDDFMDDHFKYNIYGCLEKYIPIHPDEAWKQPLQPKTSIDCRLQSGSRGLY